MMDIATINVASAQAPDTNFGADIAEAHSHGPRVLSSAELLEELHRMKRAGQLTNADLQRLLNLPSPRISEIFDGRRRITIDEMKAIVDHYGIGRTAPPPTNVRQIPRLGRVPASALREALAEASGSVTVPIRVPKEAFALEVEGDSMDLVGAPEGADAIVDPNDRKLFAGDLYVIATEDGEATFKRYMEGPARLVPCSSNPAHREILIGAEPIRVIGRVTDVVIGAGLLRRMG